MSNIIIPHSLLSAQLLSPCARLGYAFYMLAIIRFLGEYIFAFLGCVVCQGFDKCSSNWLGVLACSVYATDVKDCRRGSTLFAI